MSNFLFKEFQPVSSKEWKQKIQVDLKGADYNKTLLTKTNEGITIKPFYHSDNFKQVEILNNQSDFQICQTIFVSDEKTANYLAIDALKRGADSIKFIANITFEYKTLLKDLFSLRDEKIKVFFQLQFLNEEFILSLNEFVKNEDIFLNIDLISNLVKTGNWFYNNKKDHDILKSILNNTKNNIVVLGVDASHYQNSGANIVQQVAYVLAHANEYLNFITSDKITKQPFSINFNFSVGSNYFFEIAKLRAFRYLFDLLLDEYDINVTTNIFAEPSFRNKTLYDYNVNMLRTTTECMSAVLGGANSISNIAYDVVFHKKNEFGERISRNQLIILKEESYLKNADFAKGSYYIEELTYEIAEKALKIFKDIEKNGGFVKQLFKGTIQRKIEESADKEQSQFDDKNLVLLGTNKLPNKEDKMKDDIELYPFLKTKNHETLIKPILAKRLAEKLEQKRLTDESI